MSCTLFYKGSLKAHVNLDCVMEIIQNQARNMDVSVIQANNDICIHFRNGQSEPLVFKFNSGQVSGFCKWNGTEINEYYKILDLFVELRPVFRLLSVYDDAGIGDTYVAQKKSCRIKLCPLPVDGELLLKRVQKNNFDSPTKVETYIMDRTGLRPPHKSLLRVIVQDFIQIMNIRGKEDFNPHAVMEVIRRINFMGYDRESELTMRSFEFYFSTYLLEIWIGHTFYYKNAGVVKDLPITTSGMKTSSIAGVYGIKSIFLNRHAGGATNSKEAQMVLFAKQYYETGNLGEVVVNDTPEREIQMLFSMLQYLGLRYIGIHKNGGV